jgi:ribonuclease R
MQMDGIITGVENFGLFVMGTHLPAEGFVHITSLTDDYYKFDKAGHVISGFRSGNTYRLGDPVRVAVAAVDVERRELDLRLLEKIGGAEGGRQAKRKFNPQARQQKPRKGDRKTDGKVGRKRKKR